MIKLKNSKKIMLMALLVYGTTVAARKRPQGSQSSKQSPKLSPLTMDRTSKDDKAKKEKQVKAQQSNDVCCLSAAKCMTGLICFLPCSLCCQCCPATAEKVRKTLMSWAEITSGQK